MIKNITFYRRRKRLIMMMLLLLLTSFLQQSLAQNLLSESFNYASGTLLTNANWTSHATGTPSIVVSDGNLSRSGTIGNNIGNKISLASSGQDVRRAFTAIPTSTTGQAAYASMVVNVSAAQAGGDFFFSLGSSTAAQNARIYIKANGTGYSFGIGKTAAEADYEASVRPFGVNTFIVLKYEAFTGATNDIIRLYVNPSSASEPGTAAISIAPPIADVSSLSVAYLFQGAAINAPTLEIDGINIGSTWNSVTSAIFDYGDVPVSYDTSKEGIFMPAAHSRIAGFSLGSILPDLELRPYSVALGADNNGTNGDGVDEDAISVSVNQIRKGVPFTLNVPVTNTTGTKYLYGWIDFNNNGKFEVGEFATISFSVAGASTQVLSWTGLQTGTIATGATKLYMRLRLSDRALADYTTVASGGADIDERSIGFGAISTTSSADHGTIPNGEVEDYQIEVLNTFDYGDVPSTFENDINGVALPALHAPLAGFTIGSLLDVETVPASVISPNQNNMAGDNSVGDVDEDGLATLVSVSRGVPYSINVPVNIPSDLAGTKYLYGWLDLNGDGRFQVGEVATATSTGVGLNSLTLTWNATQTASIPIGTTNIYLRLRLSNLSLLDFNSGTNSALIDERSIGNGATSTTNSVNTPITPFGEVEDYQLSVDLYDFGDVPVGYELNNAGISYPARQMASSLYTIGETIDHEQTAQSVAIGADNNGINGDGLDEDGVGVQTITRGTPFNFFTSVSANTASNVIAWIDFNNDGKFQANEAAYASTNATSNGYQAVPAGESTVNFWFRGSQTSQIPVGVTNVYVRVRLTQTTGADNTSTTTIDERSIADGASTGIYTIPSFGEIEDYRFPVGSELYDFGDAPESYEMDKDGTAPINFKPARNFSTHTLYLGSSYDNESGPSSVTMGSDNNGNNGDGSDEDGMTSPLYIRPGAINNYNIEVKNYTGANATLVVWIDFNNNGRFEATESYSYTATPGAYLASIPFTAAQTGIIPSNTKKVYMRARLMQAEGGVTLGDQTTGTNATVVDERAIGDGLVTGTYGVVALGEVEDYQLTVIRDYGDVPVSYENGNPAFQVNSSIPDLYLGASIDYELEPSSVAAGADNNGINGDGEDEDAVSTPMMVVDGTPFTISVPVNTTITGTKYLYGWIDFNGDGVFNGNEAVVVSGSVTAGTPSHFVLTWNNSFAPSVLAEGKVYARLRLSALSLSNSNSGNATLIDTRSYGGSNASGEVEDYQFDVIAEGYDYGDAPAEYARNREGATSIYPRQVLSSVLRLGATIDTEPSAHTVPMGADNNGVNGDGLDEDGITTLLPIYKGIAYSTDVSVFNNSGSAKTLYGWIDLNNNGYFEATEMASVSIPNSPVQQTAKLSWTNTLTNNIPTGTNQLYMRLRISGQTLADYTAGGAVGLLLDERSIGDGLVSGTYGTSAIGEVEDYRLTVSTEYDYGDTPDSYDTSRNNIVAPARQAVSNRLYIGNTPPDYEAAKHTSLDALGDDISGQDDEDGVEITPIYGNGGYGYTARVQVTNNTGASKTLYGWIDFNNNGRYESSEIATINVANATNNGYVTLAWTNAQSVVSGNPAQLYMRLRLSEGTLSDFTTGTPGLFVDERALADGINTGEYAATPIIYNGEIEDHRIPITTQFDFGDAPAIYEKNSIETSVPARHRHTPDLLMGDTVDIESAPNSVAFGSDNNGVNGDGLDEDGIVTPLPILLSGTDYGVGIKVKNNLTTAATLHAWLDLDANGRFTSNEHISVAIPANSGDYATRLVWPIANYTGTTNYTYMRVRITSATLVDNVASTNVDERSIGDGANTGEYGVLINGEVEDYILPAQPTDSSIIPCDNNDDDRLGKMDPLQALFHASIAKLASGDYVVFGNSAHGSGANQMTPIKVESGSNGFNFLGTPLMVTGVSSSTSYHQYMLLSSAGLYVWGQSNGVFSGTGFRQVALPEGIGAAHIQMIDAGRNSSVGSLMLLTKTGEVWAYSNTIGHAIQGNGNVPVPGWHQVMLENNTPLTGIKDIRTSGASAIATDGNNFYTWGANVFLGDGLVASNKNFATKMIVPKGITFPIKQQDINNQVLTSYYVRDNEGKVFVLGANEEGQLGLGNTTTQTKWSMVRFINEEPEAVGNQDDVTKEIGTVKWISANNHDSYGPLFSLITEDKRIYSTGSNDGSKKGVVSPTSAYMLTANTTNSGTQMLKGKMMYVEAGGHISIVVRERSDRYGYVGHTVDGSDGCGGCTNSPTEYDFSNVPSVGPICGNVAFDYGDLDNRYNLGDMASHEIKYSQIDNPLKLGATAADSEDGPQFTVTGNGNDAMGDDNDELGDDEDAFPAFPSTPLPQKVIGSSYKLEVPLTNNTGEEAYLYGFIDWNNNGVFEHGEAVVQKVTSSASQQIITLTWADDPSVCGVSMRSFVRLRLTTELFADDLSTLEDERSFLAAPNGEVEDYYVDWTAEECFCYKPGATTGGLTLDSNVGISSLNRGAGIQDSDSWPMVRKGAWLVLESKTKGFVPNRVAFEDQDNNAATPDVPLGIPASDFVEGMMVYDTINNCMKIYTSVDEGNTFGWYCISKQACPE